MDLDQRVELIVRNTEECVTPEKLRALLETTPRPLHYIGFEISGQVHLGSGFMAGMKIADLQRAGVKCRIWLADWHTWINDKFDGDRAVIREVARGYFEQAMRASINAAGGNAADVDFILASDIYEKSQTFWPTVIEVCKNVSLARVQRSITVMGRGEGEAVDFAKLLYPPMQAADIFELGSHIAHAGIDQRKAHVLAIDTAEGLKINPLRNGKGEVVKPIALHHTILSGLGKPAQWPLPEGTSKADVKAALKMSKSKPDSAIFVTDSPDEIRRKIKKAFCAEAEVEINPILEYARFLVFGLGRGPLRIQRKPEHGGDLEFTDYLTLRDTFARKELHPMDLKAAVAEQIVALTEPIRKHFSEEPHASALKRVQELRVTR